MNAASPDTRIDGVERRLDTVEEELIDLRFRVAALTRAPAATVAPASSPPGWSPQPPNPAPASVTARPPARQRVVVPQQRPAPSAPRFTFDPSSLLGARSLAIAGGIVTLLGILFFFVLAVNRGWIGPGARILLGAAASTAVFGAGLLLRRRYGDTHSALAAAGAGLAGAYGTLLAAVALYHLVPTSGALLVAVGIAIVGTATALAWRSELIGGLGLIGAGLAPLAIAAQGGLTTVGTAFAAIVFAAVAAVSVRERWRWLLIAGGVATVPQIALLVRGHGGASLSVIALATAFSLLTVAAGIAWGLVVDRSLKPLSTGFVSSGATLAVVLSWWIWPSTSDRGVAVLVVAVVLAAIAAPLFRRAVTKDMSAFLVMLALTTGAIAFGELLSGQPLTYAWAGEAAALAWLSRRVREVRYQLYALGYVVLAALHAIAVDAPPAQFLSPSDHPATGVAAVLAVVAAALVFARQSQTWPDAYRGPFAQAVNTFQRLHPLWRSLTLWTAGVFGAYAAALVLLQLAVQSGAGFGWGHVAVDGVWVAIGVVVLVFGLRRGGSDLVAGGLAWLATVAAIAAVYDWERLAETPRSVAYLLVGAGGLAAAVLYQRLRRTELFAGIEIPPIIFSLAFALTGVYQLAPSDHLLGASILGLAAIYGACSVVIARRRDTSTMLWGVAFALAAAAAPLLLDRTWVVLTWAATAAVVALAARRLSEPRLLLGSLGYLLLALGDTLILRAPPTQFFTPLASPATGVPALLLTLAALVVFGRCAQRAQVWWAAGAITLYAISLSILGLAQQIGFGSLASSFHSGHTAVSAVWGLLGLVLLYLGLTRKPSLRIAGFVFFAVALAKLFLFDLPALSSITRALSFLAVGALLLLAGLFYQRLLDTTRTPSRNRRHSNRRDEGERGAA